MNNKAKTTPNKMNNQAILTVNDNNINKIIPKTKPDKINNKNQ